MFGRWSRERRRRIAEAQRAAATSERKEPLIEHLREEASAVAEWAQARYEENHLTELFHRSRR
jgi:hypothetical protein